MCILHRPPLLSRYLTMLVGDFSLRGCSMLAIMYERIPIRLTHQELLSIKFFTVSLLPSVRPSITIITMTSIRSIIIITKGISVASTTVASTMGAYRLAPSRSGSGVDTLMVLVATHYSPVIVCDQEVCNDIFERWSTIVYDRSCSST